MSELITSFRQLVDPMPAEQFFSDYRYRRPVHIAGRPDKFASVMSWADLNRLLDMAVWTARSLQLSLDRQRIPPGAYCRNAIDRNHAQVMQPEAQRVKDLLKQGASLLLNEIETLHPGVRAVLETIEAAHGGRGNANLYCSWKQRQAFDSHFDRHDVYALQIIGEKRWRIYQGRAENPIEHPAFLNIPQAEYDRMKGPLAEEVTMRPGDLLYLPRGQFHDALASSEASLHVTFSCVEPIGLEWLKGLWEAAVHDPLFRENLPHADGTQDAVALRRHIEGLVSRLGSMALDQEGMARAVALRRDFTVRRPSFALPSTGAPAEFAVVMPDLGAVRRGADWVIGENRIDLTLDGETGPLAAWILDRGRFLRSDLVTAFPGVADAAVEHLLDRLLSEGVIVPA